MSVELRYWDSNAFLAYFQEEEGRVDSCEAVLEEAEKGKILIVTSALTLAEVLALGGKERLPPSAMLKAKVIDFFKNEYIAVQNVTREVAELARDLVWDKKIAPKDAVHVACAIAAEASIFETYDKPLIRKGAKIKGVTFREPPPRFQPALPLQGGGQKKAPPQAETTVPLVRAREAPPEEKRPLTATRIPRVLSIPKKSGTQHAEVKSTEETRAREKSKDDSQEDEGPSKPD